MQKPTEVNGCKVVEARPTLAGSMTRRGHVILVDRGADVDRDRWVVAWIGDGDKHWDSGDYCDTLDAAQTAFQQLRN